VATTIVHYGRPTAREMDAYLATGEPLAVAGGFTIDGYAAPFVERIEGDHGAVLGLSVPLLRRLLASIDVEITELWA
jgi:septum formation protein